MAIEGKKAKLLNAQWKKHDTAPLAQGKMENMHETPN